MSTHSTRFQIFGPLRATSEGGLVGIGGHNQRAVLALLLINANRPLTSDQLIDSIWGECPPNGAKATHQAYISNLRKAIERRIGRRVPRLEYSRRTAVATRSTCISRNSMHSDSSVVDRVAPMWRTRMMTHHSPRSEPERQRNA